GRAAAVGPGAAVEPAGALPVALFEHRHQQVLLGREVVQHARLGHGGLGGDRGQGSAAVAVPGEHRRGRPHDRGAGALAPGGGRRALRGPWHVITVNAGRDPDRPRGNVGYNVVTLRSYAAALPNRNVLEFPTEHSGLPSPRT